jgi:hypothetical protein
MARPYKISEADRRRRAKHMKRVTADREQRRRDDPEFAARSNAVSRP